MQRWLLPLIALVGLLALVACAAKETTREEAKPAPAAPAAAPAEPAAKPAWQEEWERVLAAAKREGKVVVAGPQGAERRKALTELFEKRYGIPVEYQSFAGAEYVARLRSEREAGQYFWDIHIGGTTSQILELKPMGALAPIEPALILPEVKDPKNWRDGRLEFGDKDRLLLFMTTNTSDALMVNSNLVKPEELKSYKDLLDPKWKGKVGAHDPRIPGGGMARFTFYYWHKDLGPDFIRALRDQAEITILRDYRQLLEWLAQGRYAICIACSRPLAAPMIQAGVPLKVVPPQQMKEGGYLTVGVGSLTLISKAPHPNAAKVYINWLLSKEAQTEFARAGLYVSRRLDVPTDHVDPTEIPVPGWSILLDGEEGVLERRVKARPFFTEVFGK